MAEEGEEVAVVELDEQLPASKAPSSRATDIFMRRENQAGGAKYPAGSEQTAGRRVVFVAVKVAFCPLRGGNRTGYSTYPAEYLAI